MRRIIIILLAAATAVTLYFTLAALKELFSSDVNVPALAGEGIGQYRLVLISQELDSPFWEEVEKGAFTAAERNQVSLESWGTFGLNEVDFLHNIEIAIASKVDGIIVQGLDDEAFKSLTTTRAAGNGIPIITVANDVPVNESLRRTYVGSNHYEMGQLIAKQLIADMGETGKVVLVAGDQQEHFQRERVNGILDGIRAYPSIESEIVEIGKSNEEVADATNQILNREPNTKAFISVSANSASVIVREIRKRYKIEDFYLYAFDESPETIKLLKEGAIDALITQDPERMGQWSVDLIVRWLEGKNLPLDFEGYFTDIQVLTSEDLR